MFWVSGANRCNRNNHHFVCRLESVHLSPLSHKVPMSGV